MKVLCFHGSNIWPWKLKNNTLTQTAYLPMYDLFEFDHSLGRSIVRTKKFQVKMSIVAYFGSHLAMQKKTLGKTRSKILKPYDVDRRGCCDAKFQGHSLTNNCSRTIQYLEVFQNCTILQ